MVHERAGRRSGPNPDYRSTEWWPEVLVQNRHGRLVKHAYAGEGAQQPAQCLRMCAGGAAQLLDAFWPAFEQICYAKGGGRADGLCAEMPGRKLQHFQVERLKPGLCYLVHTRPPSSLTKPTRAPVVRFEGSS